MNKKLLIIVILLLLTRQMQAQDLMLQVGYEFAIALDPVYGLQKSSPFLLNNHNIGNSNAGFYCAVPGKHILEHFADIGDEANSHYFPIIYKNTWFNKNRRIRIIPGITHDKLQIQGLNPSNQDFKFTDGGNEWTLMFSYGWKIARNIEQAIHDERKHKLILNLDFQAGTFVTNDKIEVCLTTPSGELVNAQPSHRKFGNGYGYIGNIYGELGYRFCDLFSMSTGFKLGGEFIHSKANVSVNNVTGSILTNNTYGVFITPFLKINFNCINYKRK